MEGNLHTAQRIVNAEDTFCSEVQRIAGLNTTDARNVLRVYLRLKVAKVDAVIGRVIVKHGAFMEAAPMHRALTV